MDRRGFLEITGAAVIPQLPLQMFDWDQHGDGLAETVEGFGMLVGPDSDKPDPQGPYFEQWDAYNFLYQATDATERYIIQTDDTSWQSIGPTFLEYTGDGSTSGREISLPFEPTWFTLIRNDTDTAEKHEGTSFGVDGSIRVVGGTLADDIAQSTAVYTSSGGVTVGDGDDHCNVDGATYIVGAWL